MWRRHAKPAASPSLPAVAPPQENSFQIVSSNRFSPFPYQDRGKPDNPVCELKYKKKNRMTSVTVSTPLGMLRSITNELSYCDVCFQTYHRRPQGTADRFGL